MRLLRGVVGAQDLGEPHRLHRKEVIYNQRLKQWLNEMKDMIETKRGLCLQYQTRQKGDATEWHDLWYQKQQTSQGGKDRKLAVWQLTSQVRHRPKEERFQLSETWCKLIDKHYIRNFVLNVGQGEF